MNTDIRFFNKFNWTDNKNAFEKCLKTISTKKLNKQVIAIYFDEEDDEYKVHIATIMGVRLNKTAYSWDELSQLIHDNI